MVWDGRLEPLVVPTRRALLGVALGGAPVWPCSGGEGFTERSVGRRPPCYLPLVGKTTLAKNNNFDKIIREIPSWYTKFFCQKWTP